MPSTSLLGPASGVEAPAGPALDPAVRRRVLVTLVVVHVVGLAVVGAAAGSLPARVVRVLAIVGVGAVAALVVHGLPEGRAPRRRMLVAALLVGSTTAAVVIGVVHLTRVGASVRAVAGCAAMLAGPVLLAVLTAGTVRRAPRWHKLVVAPAALLLGCFVAFPVAIAWYATTQPPAALGSRTPATFGFEYEDVSFTTADGVELSGWYLPTSNGAAIVLLHGASSTRTAVLDHAAVLHREGYGVLLFDARGHGRSAGRPMDLGWYGDLDTDAAVTWVLGRPDVTADRVALVGLSMGGEEAIGAAASDRRVAAVVAEGAENRTYDDRDDWLPRGPNGWLQRGMDRLAFGLTDLMTPASPPISLREAAARIAPRPLLLIAGSGEEDAAASIARASTSASIWESGTGHTDGLADLPDEWRRRVIGFLDAALAA